LSRLPTNYRNSEAKLQLFLLATFKLLPSKYAKRHETFFSVLRVFSGPQKQSVMVKANILVWTAGTSPNPLLEMLPCKKEKGRVVVNPFMEVPDYPGVWALGDCAVVPDPAGKPYAPTAQHAIREGKVLAQNITAAIRGGREKPFVFKTIGLLAAIGRRAGVAQIFGYNFSGFFAWWMWRTIYLSKLPRFEKKCRVALDWTLDLLFTKDLVQFETLRAPVVSHTHDERLESGNNGKVPEMIRREMLQTV
jgi:NADH dehydrogenase